MSLEQVGREVVKYILDNLPEIIGTSVAIVLIAIAGSIYGIIRRKRGKRAVTSSRVIKARKTDSQLTAQYLKALVRRCSTLSFGDPASWSVSESRTDGLVTLEQIWTPLKVADSQARHGKTGSHENMSEKDQGADLIELFRSSNVPLLVLGDPGSGKSTSLAMFTVYAAQEHLSDRSKPLPVWINLSGVTADSNSDPLNLLMSGVPEIGSAANRLGAAVNTELATVLSQTVLEGRALLLLDGLDEVKEHNLV